MRCPKCYSDTQQLGENWFCLDCDWDDLIPVDMVDIVFGRIPKSDRKSQPSVNSNSDMIWGQSVKIGDVYYACFTLPQV